MNELKEVFKRAWLDTWGSIGPTGVVFYAILSVIFTYLHENGDMDMWLFSDTMDFLESLLFGMLMAAAVMYSCYFIVAPYRVMREKYLAVDKEHGELKQLIAPKLRIGDVHISMTKYAPPERAPSEDWLRKRSVPVFFIHIVVDNDSLLQINNCEAYLTRIVKTLPDGQTQDAGVSNPIKLVTASTHLNTVKVYPQLPVHFDLLFSLSTTNAFDIAPHISRPHSIPADFFSDIAEYAFHIVASGDGVPSEKRIVKVTWSGQWEKIEAVLE